MHVETERQKVLYSKHFVTSQKCPYHVTFDLDLDLEHTLDAGSSVDHTDHCVQVWLRSSHFARFLRYLALKVLESRLWPFGSRDDIGHVTTGFSMCSFLLVVNINRPRISHGCRDIKLQSYLGHDLDLLGSRDAICHVTIGFAI